LELGIRKSISEIVAHPKRTSGSALNAFGLKVIANHKSTIWRTTWRSPFVDCEHGRVAIVQEFKGRCAAWHRHEIV
jgi:hypothetical protein